MTPQEVTGTLRKDQTERWDEDTRRGEFTGCTPTKESSKGHAAYACGRHTEAKKKVQQKQVSAEQRSKTLRLGVRLASRQNQQLEQRGGLRTQLNARLNAH